MEVGLLECVMLRRWVREPDLPTAPAAGRLPGLGTQKHAHHSGQAFGQIIHFYWLVAIPGNGGKLRV